MTEQLECNPDASAWHRLGCILGYAGSTPDIVINYTVLAVNVAYLGRVIQRRQGHSRGRRRQTSAIVSLALVVGFQISLCWWVDCTGISIVWCACGGWILRSLLSCRMRNEEDEDAAIPRSNDCTADHGEGRLVLGLDALTILYYANDPITTLAHVLAVGLGSLLFSLADWWETRGNADLDGSGDYNEVDDPATSADNSTAQGASST